MDLISLFNTNIEQYIKNTYVVIDSSEISMKMPTIHIIGMGEFQETLDEYLFHLEMMNLLFVYRATIYLII